jgi:hypothetical protein
MRFRPRDADLLDPMIRAIDPRDSSMQKSLQLTGIQMPPNSLGAMIVDRQRSAALGTNPRNAFLMNRKNVDSLPIKIQSDPQYRPRRHKA